MKAILTVLCIIGISVAYGFEPQRVIVVKRGDFSEVNSMLQAGWTVAAQSSAGKQTGGNLKGDTYVVHIFTLTPPTPEARKDIEVAVAIERQRMAEDFRKRREEYLRQKTAAAEAQKVEKP